MCSSSSTFKSLELCVLSAVLSGLPLIGRNGLIMVALTEFLGLRAQYIGSSQRVPAALLMMLPSSRLRGRGNHVFSYLNRSNP